MKRITPPETRFWRLIDKSGECWVPKRTRTGSWRFWDGVDLVEAHRWSYESEVGPIPVGLIVRHKCDNPPCVRPCHLETGTTADNARDMVERRRSLRGSRHNLAKLNEEKVLDIKRRLRSGERQADLHREFGVSRMCISDIARGKKWGWLDEVR